MNRPIFPARVRLVSSIRSHDRSLFDVGAGGEPALHEGRIVVPAGDLAPGATEVLATIEPLRPEYWDHVGVGAVLPFVEGGRIVGHATVIERVWPAAPTRATAAFVRAANDLCAFVAKAEGLSLRDRLRDARTVLLSLYAAATNLPNADKVTDMEAPPVARPETWPGFAEHDAYWEVFEPYELSKPVAGSLSDDVLDVYLDVRRGLWFWEQHEIADAVWSWRFAFESHWGDHAVDALRALHRAVR